MARLFKNLRNRPKPSEQSKPAAPAEPGVVRRTSPRRVSTGPVNTPLGG